jgi:hypothetical protein
MENIDPKLDEAIKEAQKMLQLNRRGHIYIHFDGSHKVREIEIAVKK